MPSTDRIVVTGVDEVAARLHALPTKLQRKVLRPVMREEAKTVLEEAKKLVPVDADGHQLPGGKHLRDTLKVRVAPRRKRKGGGEVSMRIMTGTRAELGIPSTEKGYYPFALEYGSLKHQPIKFMEPAYRNTRGKVVKSAREKILAGIEQIMRGFQ